MTTERQKVLSDMENEELIRRGALIQDQKSELDAELRLIKIVLLERMKSSNATSLLHSTIQCDGKVSATEYNYSKLHNLREFLSPEQISKFYSPEREEVVVVKEKYDMRIGKGYIKYGSEIKDIIDSATIQGRLYDITLKYK